MMKPKFLNSTNLMSAVLLTYVVVLTAGTHWPNLSQGTAEYNDKVAHYLAYCILGMLISGAWATRRRLSCGSVAAIIAIVAVYGAIDELTQIPIPGRFGDLYDWIADLLGGITGIFSFWLVYTLVRSWQAMGSTAGTEPEPM